MFYGSWLDFKKCKNFGRQVTVYVEYGNTFWVSVLKACLMIICLCNDILQYRAEKTQPVITLT